MSMAHGVECRVPYVTQEMMELALAVPPQLKVREERGRRHGKWILRRAFDGILPDEIIWGTKRNFGDGSGAKALLDDAVRLASDGFDLAAHKRRHRRDWLRQPEEAWAHKLLLDEFGENPWLLRNVARWDRLRTRYDGETPNDGRVPIWKRLARWR
jgi:asparagine synthase (glutamine-hydrolysing)